MNETRSHFTTVNGLRLHAFVAGDPAAPAVLLLHGWPTSAQLYRNILPNLARAGRFAIAPDLPGFGQSDKPTRIRYNAACFNDAIDGVLASLGVERTALVIHDLGGPIGLCWAARHPERVRALAVLNTLVGPKLSWAALLFLIATYIPGLAGLLASPRGITWGLRLGVADRARITPEVARLYTEPFENRAARRALLRAARGLRPRDLVAGQAWLYAFRGPVHCIYGTRDRVLPDVAKTMARIVRHVPGARLTALPQCGHFLQEEVPEELSRLLADFLTEVGAPTTTTPS